MTKNKDLDLLLENKDYLNFISLALTLNNKEYLEEFIRTIDINNNIFENIELYEKELNKFENNIYAIIILAFIYESNKDYDKFISQSIMAIEIDNNKLLNKEYSIMRLIFHLGFYYAINKEFDEAIKYIKIIQNYDYYYIASFHFLGNLYFDLKQYDLAIPNYLKHIQLSTSNCKTSDDLITKNGWYIKESFYRLQKCYELSLAKK
jgi:tetratricopeptide (TPR) repeat protein